MTEESEGGVAGPILFRQESTSHLSFDAEEGKEARRNPFGLQLFGLDVTVGAAGQIDLCVLIAAMPDSVRLCRLHSRNLICATNMRRKW